MMMLPGAGLPTGGVAVAAMPNGPMPAGPMPVGAGRAQRRARAAEVLLLDALDRESRAPQGRIAVVVRLALLPAPGPRPYHRRIARALLDDCAQRHGGHVFRLSGGTLVLLAAPRAATTADAGPLALPALLARLLHAEEAREPVAEALALGTELPRLRALIDADAAAPEEPELDEPRPRNPFARRRAPAAEPADGPAARGTPDSSALALSGGIDTLLAFSAAVRLPHHGAPAATPIRPAWRALRVVPALLAQRLDGAGAADPWLRLHLAQTLAAALVARLDAAWGDGTPLDPTPRRGIPPLLLALPPAVVNGAGFAALAQRLRDQAAPHGDAPVIAIALAEASADPAAFANAAATLRAAGMRLMLDGVSHHALLLARPEALGADLIALSWSASLPRLTTARHGELLEAIRRVGPGRVVLAGADGEAALRWGRAAGIQLFQGSHAEAMLAATRLMACGGASICLMRGCQGRAAAATNAGRAGCRSPRLLDQVMPDPVHSVASGAVASRALGAA